MVSSDEAHVICVHGSEGSQSVAHQGEQCYKDKIHHIGSIALSLSSGDPSDQEKDPGSSTQSNKKRVGEDKKTKGLADVLLEASPASLEPFLPGMHQVPNVVIKLLLVFLSPVVEANAMGKYGITRVAQIR